MIISPSHSVPPNSLHVSAPHSDTVPGWIPLQIKLFHPYKCGELILDFEKRTLTISGNIVHLTPISFQITYFLIKWLYQKKYKELEWERHEYWNVTFGYNWRLCRSFFYTLYLYQSSIHHYMEDLSLGCKRHPDYEIAVSFNILIPNISPADKVSLYSITPIKVAATGSTDAKIEAFPLSKFLGPAVYRQNASTVLKKPNFKLADKNSHASSKYPCQNYHSWCKFFHYPASLYPKRMITQQALLRNHPWNTVFTIIQICRAVQPKSDWIFYYI